MPSMGLSIEELSELRAKPVGLQRRAQQLAITRAGRRIATGFGIVELIVGPIVRYDRSLQRQGHVARSRAASTLMRRFWDDVDRGKLDGIGGLIEGYTMRADGTELWGITLVGVGPSAGAVLAASGKVGQWHAENYWYYWCTPKYDPK